MRYALSLMLILSPITTYGLTEHQQYVKGIAKKIGSQICTHGMCFEDTLQAIAWQESSFGLNIIGDAKRTKYYYFNNNKKVFIKRSDTIKDGGKRYIITNGVVKEVHSEVEFKRIEESSLGPFQIKLETAKYTIRKEKLNKYYDYLYDDQKLVNKLLTDVEFSATIAVNYLIINYKRALRRSHKNPWFYTVSKYNGGHKNFKYVNLISDKLGKL